MLAGRTFAMDDDPAVILGDMLCDLLARKLDFLRVVAVPVHRGGLLIYRYRLGKDSLLRLCPGVCSVVAYRPTGFGER
jgi:hypothetical protein